MAIFDHEVCVYVCVWEEGAAGYSPTLTLNLTLTVCVRAHVPTQRRQDIPAHDEVTEVGELRFWLYMALLTACIGTLVPLPYSWAIHGT